MDGWSRQRDVGRRLALRSLKMAAAGADKLRAPGDGVVVLIYHRVGAQAPVEIDLPAEMFDAQMAWLAASQRATTLDRAVDLLDPCDRHTPMAGAPVVVTFDDGTADLVDIALPILARHGIPATVYLATQFVDEGRRWPADGQPLSWAGAREMLASGLITVGSHTHSHVLLDRLAPDEAARELDRSRELIEDHLQVAAEHLAYPKAVAPSARVEAMVRERFRSAALGGNRPNPYAGTDCHRLSRTAVQVSDGMTYFERKANGGMGLEDTFRRVANRVRYRDVVS
jgi:peptidoglycan/xylan/chitin deacetylase (PgdA/CDA1 family)